MGGAALACIPLAAGWSLLGEEAQHLEESERWYWSECHGRGLRRPRFLDCEGGSWDPSWASFRKRLQEDPPGRQLPESRPPGAATAQLAQQLLQSWTGETEVERGHLLFARRLVRDLASPLSQGDARPTYDESSVGPDGFMSDFALEGFCLYGLVGALFVRAVELLAAPTQESAALALTGVRLALGLFGPVSELSLLENSCWPFSWLELRLLEEGLVKALSTPEMEPHWRRPLEGPPRMESEVDLHLAMAMALPEHPAVVFLDTVKAEARHHLQQVLGQKLHVVGLGDHATATLDAGLMVKRAVTEAAPTTRVEITMSGLSCPESQAGRHHCRLKCQVAVNEPEPAYGLCLCLGPTLGLQLMASPADATLELRNVNSLLYTADLDIGVAGRSARVVVDTGSADFWLKPNLLVEEVHGQKLVSASPRRQDVGGQLLVPEYLIRYGLGEVIAIPIVEERVCAGSLQGFREVLRLSGLAGLAFPLLQQAPTNQTLLQALQLQSGCKHFGFSLALRGEGGESLLSLGEVKDLVKAMEKAEGGSSVPVKVVNRDQDAAPGYWMVEVKMSVFNGKNQNQLLLAKGKGLLDSGSSFLAALVGYIVMALTHGHGGLPSLAVDESQRLLCRCDAGLNDLVFEVFGEDGRTLKDDLLEPPTIIGDPFLRKVSVVFDVDATRVHVLPVGGKKGAALVAEGLAAGPPRELALLGLASLLSAALAATCAWRRSWQGPGGAGHYQYLAM
eukprot:s2591_g9.t1